MDQIPLDEAPGYETERFFGATGPTFPVLVTPTTAGAELTAPAYVEWRSWRDLDGTVRIEMRFLDD